MEIFLIEHKLFGLVIGISTFLVIGLFHPLVIKAEYYLGTRSWWGFLLSGIVFAIISYLSESIMFSVISGVTSFSSFWSILEVFEQKKRVQKGWFPRNPKRKEK